jgi:hypothetical protein
MPVSIPNDPRQRSLPDPGDVNWGEGFNQTLISIVQQLNSFEQQYANENPPSGSDFDALSAVVSAIENFYPMPAGISDTIGPDAVDLQYQRNDSTETASGSSSFAAGGRNTVSGAYGMAVGYRNRVEGLAGAATGEQNVVEGRTALAFGTQARAREKGAQALGENGFGTGQSQRVELVRNAETSADEWTEAGAIELESGPSGSAVKLQVTAVGVSSAGTAHVVEFDAVGIGGNPYTLPVTDKTVRHDSGNTSWDAQLVGTATGVRVEVKGIGPVRWTVFCEYVESHAA